jgi:glutathione S-transferase
MAVVIPKQPALLHWLAERDASLRLIGGMGSEHRMDVLRWLSFVATELHKSFSPWPWCADVPESSQDLMRATL